jgi:hypothetical protein
MRVVLDVVPLTAVVSSVLFRLAPDSGRSATRDADSARPHASRCPNHYRHRRGHHQTDGACSAMRTAEHAACSRPILIVSPTGDVRFWG